MNNIISRFKNQRVSQLIHLKNRRPGEPLHRVCNCYRLKAKRSHQVSLRKKDGAARAHYGDTQTCGSVWDCQVCSSIITESRSQDTQVAIDIWRSMHPDNCVIMISFTTPHYAFQPLQDVLTIQDKAIRIMKKQPQKGSYKVYRTIIQEIESIGNYTGREVTWGMLNGWHPHRHVLYFCKRQNIAQLRRLQFDTINAFAVAFLKAGGEIRNMNHFRQRAVKVDQITDNNGYQRISRYITSVEGDTWTLAKEATKGIVKTAKNGNITPFGMLEAIRQGDKHSGLYSVKFYEYSKTMKGKKQFFPSPGLSDHLGIKHKTDQDIMEERKTGNHYSFLTDPEWDLINKMDIRGEILTLTEGNEFEFMTKLDEFLKPYKKECA